MSVITLTLPYSGDVSVNRYLARRKDGGSFIRESSRLWGLVLRASLNYCLKGSLTPGYLAPSHPFDVDVHVNFPRKFSKRSGDATNFDKFIRDVVAETLGVDDAGTSGTPTATYGNGEQASIKVTVILHPEPSLVVDEIQEDRELCLI